MKKKLILGCLVPLVAIPVLLVLIGFLLPSSFEVERRPLLARRSLPKRYPHGVPEGPIGEA